MPDERSNMPGLHASIGGTGSPVAGLLLAGGLARRMGGGDKSLRQLGDRPLLSHVIARFGDQVHCLALNANGDPTRFAAFGIPVVPDGIEGFAGPLAGVSAGLDWVAANHPECAFMASVATDAPFLPRNLVSALSRARDESGADVACAQSGGRAQPVFALWPVRLREDLRQAVREEGIRKVDQWTARYRVVQVEFDDALIDPFFNANRPEDLARAESLLDRNFGSLVLG